VSAIRLLRTSNQSRGPSSFHDARVPSNVSKRPSFICILWLRLSLTRTLADDKLGATAGVIDGCHDLPTSGPEVVAFVDGIGSFLFRRVSSRPDCLVFPLHSIHNFLSIRVTRTVRPPTSRRVIGCGAVGSRSRGGYSTPIGKHSGRRDSRCHRLRCPGWRG